MACSVKFILPLRGVRNSWETEARSRDLYALLASAAMRLSRSVVSVTLITITAFPIKSEGVNLIRRFLVCVSSELHEEAQEVSAVTDFS